MDGLKLHGSIWIDCRDRALLGKGKIELLKRIDKSGSLNKAAKEMKMSYKAAWDALNQINAASQEPLVITATGGKNGGGSRLSPSGKLYVKLYEKIYDEQRQFFSSLEQKIGDFDKFSRFLNRSSIRTSARNQLLCKITQIKKIELMSEISLDFGSDLPLLAQITAKSVKELGLKIGMEIYAIFKSSWVEFADTCEGENRFLAQVKSIVSSHGVSEAALALPNGAIFTASFESAQKTLQKGDKTAIFINKTNIILGV